MALFYIFENLCNIWLNRNQLDSYVSFCIHTGVIYRASSNPCGLLRVKETKVH